MLRTSGPCPGFPDVASVAKLLTEIGVPVLALWSTKHLLVDQNFHFPLHLLLSQLLLICLVLLWKGSYRQFGSWPDCRSMLKAQIAAYSTPIDAFKLIAATTCLVLSLPLLAQAILHTSNYSILPMLVGLASLTELTASKYTSQDMRKSSLGCVLLVSFFAFVVVIIDDYRVTVNGLLFGLSGLGIYCFAMFILRAHVKTALISTQAAGSYSLHQLVPALGLLISVFITACGALVLENRSDLFQMLLLVNPLWLVLNLASVAITLTHSHVVELLYPPRVPEQNYDDHDLAKLSLFTGLSILFNDITGKPGYSTVPQIVIFTGTFLIAFLCNRLRLNPPIRWRTPTPFSSTADEDTLTTESSSILGQGQNGIQTAGSKHLSTRLSRLDSESCFCEQQETLPTCAHLDETLQQETEQHSAPRNPGTSLTNFICVAMVWIALVFANSHIFSSRVLQRASPSLDLEYQPKGDVDVVISMYKEETDSVVAMISQLKGIFDRKGRSIAIFIYVKDEDADTAELSNRLGATSLITKRPNVGREGETYLYHILSRFDNLAAHTLFIQAHAHNFWEIQRRIEAYLVPNTGMLSLGFSGNICQCNTCSDRWGWEDGEVVASFYKQVYNDSCSTVLLSYKGQFIASAKRLRGVNRKVYEDLHSALIDSHSWAHSEPYLRNRPDSLNAPYFGYTLERLWSILLQCSDLDVALKCPTLLGGTRRGGDRSDCQCFDS